MYEQAKTILIVDDSSLVRLILKKEFAAHGYEVIEAVDGVDALVKIVSGKRIDLITMDIEMPKMNGFKACYELRKEKFKKYFSHCDGNQAPLIFITANDTVADRLQGFELGAADFIAKPFKEGDVLAAVNKYFEPEDCYLAGTTVLVVDDDYIPIKIVSDCLTPLGANILTARNGKEAFQLAEDYQEEIDLVITDYFMPELDGIGLCRLLKQSSMLPHVPIIFLSATDNQSTILELFRAGATDYLPKPFVKEELLSRVKVHLNERCLVNRFLEEVQSHKLAEEAAEQTSRAKSEFLANMSHELRSPLNSLLVLAQLLSENKDKHLSANEVKFAETIHNSGKDLLGLINDLLDLSKVEAGRMEIQIEHTDLSLFLDDLLARYQPLAEQKGVELVTRLDPGLPRVIKTDIQRVSQVVKNLLSNALKFTSKGQIEIAIIKPDEKVKLSKCGLSPERAIGFSVSDEGIGIPADKLKLIFEAFTQAEGGLTTTKYGGTGLGLSISREFSKFLGGEIQVSSTQGEGSVFTMYLPLQSVGDKQLVQPVFKDISKGEKADPKSVNKQTENIIIKKNEPEKKDSSFDSTSKNLALWAR
jgi:signal transduction histidine kinase